MNTAKSPILTSTSISVLACAGFAALVAGRDVWWELSLSKHQSPLGFACLMWSIIAMMSTTILVAQGRLMQLVRRLAEPQFAFLSAAYGGLAALIFGLGFFVISGIGAGLCNLVEYSVYAVATVLFAVNFRGEVFEKHRFIEYAISFVGLILLSSQLDMTGFRFAGLAAIISMLVATSDYVSKELRTTWGCTATETLMLRSFPSTLFLLGSVIATGTTVVPSSEAVAASVLCGFAPLFLLCTALGQTALQNLPRWLFLVPVIAFFATLPQNWESNGQPLVILGAVVVPVAIFAGAIGWTRAAWLCLLTFCPRTPHSGIADFHNLSTKSSPGTDGINL